MKICSNPKCKEKNPQLVDKFARDRRNKDGLQSQCQSCQKASDRIRNKKPERRAAVNLWKEKHPSYMPAYLRRYKLKNKYGITHDDYVGIFEYQGRRCPICGSLDPSTKNGWNIDHNHITKEIRGILCWPCNIVLGIHERFGTPIAKEFSTYLSNPPARAVLKRV